MIPADVLQRPKTGFSLPVNDQLRDQLRESCEAAVAVTAGISFLDRRAVRSRWDDCAAGHDHTYCNKDLVPGAPGGLRMPIEGPIVTRPAGRNRAVREVKVAESFMVDLLRLAPARTQRNEHPAGVVRFARSSYDRLLVCQIYGPSQGL